MAVFFKDMGICIKILKAMKKHQIPPKIEEVTKTKRLSIEY